MDRGESFSTENEIKFVILGLGAVGKSNLALRFTQGEFEEDYNPTLQETFIKSVNVDNKPVTLEILDTAGYEEFEVMQENWISQGQGFILVYAVDNRESFQEIKKLKKRIDRMKDYAQVSSILVGNKIDLPNNVVPTEEGKALATELNMLFLETSAKTGINCDEVFYSLVRDIRAKEIPVVEKKEDPFWESVFKKCNLI